ncbi:DUF6496 domain-containing protein [Sphingomonas jatrophae]|uniref:Rho termination factor, N-terminal domain n=1 Tax=Sphingomonas jatrophae TaxID=1166337 RepID=A0A1I6JBC2_9SPHN|nr:DUF6496 domain-containing protein [Sphingomonas jatrophae]SFR76236.1 hypothetical protein SAMN05192580_0056 [Sphingomonas jatrophae]
MAKQSKAQKDVMERVLHEYKEGELETSAGRKVKSRKQAIAIGLSEAGASNQQTPAENRKRLKQTKARERADESGPTRAQLYEQAKKRDIPGRSKMSKAELAEALKR